MWFILRMLVRKNMFSVYIQIMIWYMNATFVMTNPVCIIPLHRGLTVFENIMVIPLNYTNIAFHPVDGIRRYHPILIIMS